MKILLFTAMSLFFMTGVVLFFMMGNQRSEAVQKEAKVETAKGEKVKVFVDLRVGIGIGVGSCASPSIPIPIAIPTPMIWVVSPCLDESRILLSQKK